ncbi:MAG TPA: outer membrane beta-barrel protein [Stellaceae bacterium]|jgi:hypothetical protein|nr:outer membrane beta-barrel protein [Stellaceae bacterium]
MKHLATSSVVLTGLLGTAAILAASSIAHAQDEFAHPQSYKFDGGPLGELEGNAAVDGYFYWQSGAGDGSTVGNHSTGAKVNAWEVEVAKPANIADFWGFGVQAAQYQDINLGLNKPKNVNDDRFQTGPIRTVYLAIAPLQGFKLSVGQLPSLEGYESVFPWNNPVALRTAVNPSQNSNSKGVELDYANGQYSGSLMFSDGYDTNVYNYFTWLGTDKFDANNELNIYGGAPVGTTGPNAFAYGEGGMPSGGAFGVGGQQQLAVVNSNMIGAWYTWRSGNLTVIPELQYQFTPKLTDFATETSGGVSDDIPKFTSNFVAALFGIYKIPDTHFSISGWVEYGTSNGSAPQDVWFAAPNQKLVGLAIAPAWKYNKIYVRLNLGYAHLLNMGTPISGYGAGGTDRNTAIGTTEFGFVF